MSSSVLIHESRFIGPTRPYNCHRSKCGMSRMGFAFTGVAAAGLPVMGFSLAAQPVQGVERLEFKAERYNFWTWRGHKIHYVVQGEGPPVVLIIHGFGAYAFRWRFAALCPPPSVFPFSFICLHLLVVVCKFL